MSRNSFNAAIKRDDAAMDASPPRAVTVPGQDLADLAAMLARVEALVAADMTPEPGDSGAIGRIADIAFVLHERDVEASLCDALDAAVLEIGAGAFKQDRGRRARQAAEMLRELSQRINAMIVPSDSSRSEPPAATNKIEDELPRPVAPFRGAQPSTAAAAGLALEKSLGGQGTAVMKVAGGVAGPRPSAAAATRPAEPAAASLLEDDSLLLTAANKAASSNKPASNELSPRKASYRDILPRREPAALGSASAPAARDESLGSSLGTSSANSSVNSLGSKDAPRLNPEDDPGDLFEPVVGMPPSALPAPAIETVAQLPVPENELALVPEYAGITAGGGAPFEDNALGPLAAATGSLAAGGFPVESSDLPLMPLRFTAPVVPPSVPRPEPADPLAPVRALSDEEMIALFS